MRSKIMYIPLDERPCNYEYPQSILDISDYELLRPPFTLLGKKKKPADIDKIWTWMKENVDEVTHLVISIDMFLYGGIVPSRLHQDSLQEVVKRLNRIKELKKINPELKIYSFNLIMRVPAYNSDDEEPDYYENYGRKIYKYGSIQDKIERSIASSDENERFEELKEEIPEEYLTDFINRRKINHQINLKVVDMVKDGVIDFLVIPMDDNSEYGFSSQERTKIMTHVHQLELMDRVYAYPGADEVGSILTARAFTDITGHKSRVFVKYASEKGKMLIPLLEDRSLCETVKYQIIAAGGVLVDNSTMADYILLINPPSEATINIVDGWSSLLERPEIDDPDRNLNELVEAADFYISQEIPCAVADVAMVNGSDPILMKFLKSYNLLDKIISYGGWNTSSNTLGTVVSHAHIASYYSNRGELSVERKTSSEKFLYLRYLEDWGYQHLVRTDVTNKLEEYGLNYFDLGDKGSFISQLIKEKLIEFSAENISGINYDFDVYMPWNRMFELGIKMS